jgi:dipeptidyl aminopeptidase/acylaminoacyl peptidase
MIKWGFVSVSITIATFLAVDGCRNHQGAKPSSAAFQVERTRSILPIEDFFRNPERISFSISPDGKYFSYLAPYMNRLNIFVEPVDGGIPVRITSDTAKDIRNYSWANNEHIVYLQDKNGNENFKLFVCGKFGQEARCITDFEGVRTELIEDWNKQDNWTYVTMNKRDPRIFDPYRINIKTGFLEQLAENPGGISEWFTDHSGNLRLAVSTDNLLTSILYREKVGDPFRTILQVDFKNTIQPLYFAANNREIYALSNIGRDKTAVVKIDLSTGKETEVLYSHFAYDMQGLCYSKKRKKVTSVSYYTWRKEEIFFDEYYRRIQKSAEEKLPGYELSISCANTDESKLIVRAYNDRTPGAYYLYNADNGAIRKIASIAPWISEENMAVTKPIHFKSRDGLTIHGYLTLPAGGDSTNLPLVVNPHGGGPWYRNVWSYNPEVQFLANRGYAVLQLNYRGSTGYGKSFWMASFKEWGGKMQEDIMDGVQWVIAQGVADKKRIAIYGASFGGYVALCGLTFNPEMFACGIDYVGISNLFTFLKGIPPYWEPYLAMMHEMVGNPQKDSLLLAKQSPFFHVDNIRAPLMIIQGANDVRVKKAHTDQFVMALRNRGVNVEYIVKEGEGHGFTREENRLELYKAIEVFLQKHLMGQPLP